jgi:hypothetical protein
MGEAGFYLKVFPEDLVKVKDSFTGKFLKEELK